MRAEVFAPAPSAPPAAPASAAPPDARTGHRAHAEPAPARETVWEPVSAETESWEKPSRLLAIVLHGAHGRVFLAEHGVHRVHADGGVALVRCRVTCERRAEPQYDRSLEEGFFFEGEARRIRAGRGVVLDVRTQRETSWEEGALLALGPLQESWVLQRILTGGEDDEALTDPEDRAAAAPSARHVQGTRATTTTG